MTTRKRNTFFDTGSDAESGDESANDIGYDSEERDGRVARVSKRRKVVQESRLAEQESDGGQSEDDQDVENTFEDQDEDKKKSQPNELQKDNLQQHIKPSKRNKPPKPSLKTGVIYLSRIPPFLKPQTLRHLLQPYTRHGVSRIFLTPESPEARKRRISNGGNRKHSYEDGWVEFHSKRDAKTVVAACNGQTIGAGRSKSSGSFYRDDVWSMRYLTGFKWSDLVGERRDEEAEREARSAAERRKEKRERAAFLENVEKAKIAETRRLKALNGAGAGEGSVGAASQHVREFRQNEVKSKQVEEAASERKVLDDGVKKVLRRIF